MASIRARARVRGSPKGYSRVPVGRQVHLPLSHLVLFLFRHRSFWMPVSELMPCPQILTGLLLLSYPSKSLHLTTLGHLGLLLKRLPTSYAYQPTQKSDELLHTEAIPLRLRHVCSRHQPSELSKAGPPKWIMLIRVVEAPRQWTCCILQI